VKNKIQSNYIYLIFFIPLAPHFETNFSFLHMDDIPIVLYLLIFFVFENKKKFVFEIKNFIPIALFISYLLIQNIVLSRESINTEIFRYFFYLLIFIHLSKVIQKNDSVKNLPMYLFLFLSCFSILSYFFKLNLGTDSYDYWNIGLNLNQWGFTPGRVNGFQAGGPNSFGDLICILGLFTLVRIKQSYKSFVIILSLVACFFTYSRSSLLVLTFLILVFIIFNDNKRKNLASLILAFLFILNFGLIDRFTSEKETEGIQDRIEMQTATAGFLSNLNISNLLIGSGYNNIGVVNDKIGNIEDFNDDLRVTGPHNSYLFFILKYGIIGFILYSSIFLKLLQKIFKSSLKDSVSDASVLSIFAFIILGIASDLLHNHTVVWLMYYLLSDINE
tara:strand:+ start:11554 stop:12720 length:1167 start_codon:yes stop_codon:yes gene_type:complete